MTAATGERPYTLRGIQQMLGVSRAVVGGFIDAGFIAPERGPRNQLRFGFHDVALLRSACGMQAAQIPAAKILRALRRLRARLPATAPRQGLRITAVGDELAVRQGEQPLTASSGQLLFDFEVAPRVAPVAFLQREEAAPAKKDDLAERWFARAADLEPSDLGRAEAAYRKAIAARPDFCDAYLNLGAMLVEGGRSGAAVALYAEALTHCPGEALLHFNQAIALEDLGQPAVALVAYETSVALAPALADAHYNAARLYQQLGNAQKAVRHFNAYRRLQK